MTTEVNSYYIRVLNKERSVNQMNIVFTVFVGLPPPTQISLIAAAVIIVVLIYIISRKLLNLGYIIATEVIKLLHLVLKRAERIHIGQLIDIINEKKKAPPATTTLKNGRPNDR
jgi:hypothetical protein